MNWLKRLMGNALATLMQYFQSGKAAKDAQWALEHVHEALPVVATVVDIGTAMTPTGVDDLLWKTVKAKYPSLWDGTLKTKDELGVYSLGIATELFKEKYPTVDTTRARMAVQNAYADYKALKEQVV